MTESTAACWGRVKYDEKTAPFKLVPKTCRVLDVPCGGGCLTLQLAVFERIGKTKL